MNGPTTRFIQVIQAIFTGVFSLFEDTNSVTIFAIPFALLIIFIVPAIVFGRRHG